MCGVADSSLGGSNEEAKDNARQQTDHRQKGGIGFFHGKASLPESFYFQYGKSRLICPLPGKIKTRWPKQAAGFLMLLNSFQHGPGSKPGDEHKRGKLRELFCR